MDLRDVAKLDESFDGIFASGCLYHLSKDEFTSFLRDANGILNPGGILYMSMKIGSGSHVLTTPGPDYPGGVASQQSLIGPRFYQYYQHQELLNLFLPHFNLLQWRDKEVQKEGVHEYWLAGD